MCYGLYTSWRGTLSSAIRDPTIGTTYRYENDPVVPHHRRKRLGGVLPCDIYSSSEGIVIVNRAGLLLESCNRVRSIEIVIVNRYRGGLPCPFRIVNRAALLSLTTSQCHFIEAMSPSLS